MLPAAYLLVRCPRPGANIEAHPRFNPRTYRRGLVCGLDEEVLLLTGGFLGCWVGFWVRLFFFCAVVELVKGIYFLSEILFRTSC